MARSGKDCADSSLLKAVEQCRISRRISHELVVITGDRVGEDLWMIGCLLFGFWTEVAILSLGTRESSRKLNYKVESSVDVSFSAENTSPKSCYHHLRDENDGRRTKQFLRS